MATPKWPTRKSSKLRNLKQTSLRKSVAARVLGGIEPKESGKGAKPQAHT